MLIMAVFVHGGIAIALGMVTFGTIMIVANGAFIEPELTRRGLINYGELKLKRCRARSIPTSLAPYLQIDYLFAMQNRCCSPRMNNSLSTGAGVASTPSPTLFVATTLSWLASSITTVVPFRAVK